MFLRVMTTLLLVAGALQAQTTNGFDTFIRPYITSNNFSGNVLIEHHGKVIFERSYGYADREHRRANRGMTLFHIASISMQYTSAAVLRLIEQQRLKCDTNIADLLPNTAGADNITVCDLLLQQSGLDDINSHSDYTEILQHHQTPVSLVAQIDGHPLSFSPGTKHMREEHSAFNVLALLLEKKTGHAFPQALEQILFQPLKLHATYADDDGPAPRSMARGYQPKGVIDLQPAPRIHWSAKAGNGSIVTTTADELHLVHALFDENFLNPEMRQRLLETKPRVGYGWFRADDVDFHARTYSMNGRAPGFASYVLHIPQEGLTVIVFSNIYSSAPSEIGDGLARIALGLPHTTFHPLQNAPNTISEPVRFSFPADFFQSNADITIFTDKGETLLRWPSGDVSPLIPISADEWVDRAYWEPVRLDRDASGHPVALHYDRFRGEIAR